MYLRTVAKLMKTFDYTMISLYLKQWIFATVKSLLIMVLGHQNILSSMSGSSNLQPALQLAAVAAHLAPRSRPWAPFLQFGMPMFAPFLTRPHFGGPPQHNLLNINNINSTSNNSHSSNLSAQRNQSPPSEDSNDERGKFCNAFPTANWKMFEKSFCIAWLKLLSVSIYLPVHSQAHDRINFHDFQLKPTMMWLHTFQFIPQT